MSFYEQEPGGAIVPLKGELPQEAMQAIERADEETIVSQLTGSNLARDVYLYSYPISTQDGAKEVIGISVEGAKEIARLLGNIEILPDMRVEERDGYFYAALRGKDLTRNTTLMGVGRQSQFILGKGNSPTDRRDELAFVKAVAKGQRNTILALAPQIALFQIVRNFAAMGKVGRLPAPQANVPPPPPAPAAQASGAAATKAPPPAKPPVKAAKAGPAGLGFANVAEQNKMRRQLFGILRGEPLNCGDEAIKAWLEKKSITSTKELPKIMLEQLTKDANELKELAEPVRLDELP